MHLTNLKKLGAKSTILLSSVALVACGGGGSDGYYGDQNGNNSNNNTGGNNSSSDSSTVAESLNVSLTDAEGASIVQAQDNSKVLVAVQVLNADKGGIAGKQVKLSIADSGKIGVTSKSSTIITSESGIATFELNVPALNAASGKVLLTATVDGTTISQIYTLNIQKTSTIQSDYNLNIQQGVVLNLPKGSTTISAQVTDKNGGVKSGQAITLTLPEQMQGKFSISTGSTMTTDANGNASFSIVANSELTTTEIESFVAASQSLSFLLVDDHKAEKKAQAAITFKNLADVVQKLEIVTPDSAVLAKGGVPFKVRVYAKNSDGNILANKAVKLAFTDKSAAYGVSIANAEVQTNSQGFAEFTLTSNSDYPIALSQQGINLKASYVDTAEIFAESTVSVITADTNAVDQDAIQRLQIASSYKVNASNDTVTVTVQAINNRGFGATKGKIKLSLNSQAESNGVTFDGGAEHEFNTTNNGIVSYTLRTNAKTPEAITALVSAGITATFTTDNNISNNIKITVEDEEVSEEAVQYLAIDPITSSFDYTKDQTITVKVKAIGVEGSALKGEKISLKIDNVSVADLAALGLSLTGQSSKLTDETGYVSFTYQYKASGSATQKALALNGVRLLVQSLNNKVQNLTLNFKAPTDQGTIDLDYLNLNMDGSRVITLQQEQTIAVAVNAVGTDGKVLAGQKVSIGLNDAALTNGVTLGTASALTTSSTGVANFSLKVKANNASELENLVANGITVAVKATREDGTAYTLVRKITITKPVIVLPDLAGLNLSYDVQTVSVLGGEVRVKVKAQDETGNSIANTPLAIALSGLMGSRVSLSDSALTTNSKGEAEFTVKVAEGAYDASLIKNGITFAIVGTNLNNGDRIQQTGTIQVAIPKDSVNLRLTADDTQLELGKTYQVQVAVKDELGANTGYPVNLSLNTEAVAAGVKLSADSVVTSANGMVPISLILPKEIPSTAKQALLNSGIKVRGFITNPKGEKLETTLSFSVYEAINTNHLIVQSTKSSMSVDGDKSIVTVMLLDQNNQPVRNQEVKLAANNAATLIIGTPGSGNQTNTSTPQTVVTDSNGNAFFSVEIDEKTVDADLLVASGIELTATHTNDAGTVQQVYRITAFKPAPVAQPQPQPARYSLRIQSSKPSLNVRNDISDVTVTLVDENGGGIADKYVTLAISDFIRNGAIIVGASGLTTDVNGQAIFKVQIDENTRAANYDAATFDADNLNLTARFSEEGYVDATQITQVNIVQAVVQNPIASIVIGVNPTEVSSSNDGVYYTRNLSVSVVDFDGKPLANQSVMMDITPLTYRKGSYIWRNALLVGTASPKEQWIAAGESYYDLSNPNIYVNNGVAMNNNGTPDDKLDDYAAAFITQPLVSCIANAGGQAVSNSEVLNVPVKVPTFLGQSTTATYTTDKDGKFDFTIRYPKIYAHWLNVQIGASSTVASLPFRTTYNLGLPALTSDYSSNGTFGPNLNSPYGVNTGTCP